MQRDFLRIARECRDRGHTIHIYTMSWEGENEPGFHVHIIKARGMQNHTRIKSFVRSALQQLAREKFDAVIGFSKMPGLDIYYAADVCFQKRAQEKHRAFYKLLPRYRTLAKLEQAVFKPEASTSILAISPFTQAEFNACYQTQAERFHLLPPGIAADRMAPDNADIIREQMRDQFHLRQEDFLLLMVGSGFKTKGVDRAIHAVAALPEQLRSRCQLFVIGQDAADSFQLQAKKLGIAERVRFLGGRSDVADFMLAADLLLHPAYHENTGTVLLEALVAGLPVITTEVCGYAHYIQSALAGVVLASPFNQDMFNQTIADALCSDVRYEWSKNGLAFAKHADIYSMPGKAADLIEQLAHKNSFAAMMNLNGESFRKQPGRQTLRVKFNDRYYFIKKHYGVGWKEIIKNLLQLKKPVLGARNEKRAIEKLQALGIPVPNIIAYGEQGGNPASQQSYILLQELAPTISLEHLMEQWRSNPPTSAQKRQLIKAVAHIASVMHENGVNHRDFYLCHFLLHQTSGQLHLIDLHRAEIRETLPERWRIKDLAGLYFSSLNSGLSKRDYLRFIQHYRNKPLRDIISNESKRWHKVKKRGEQLYREHC